MGRRCLKRPVPVMDGLPKCLKTRDEGLTVTESGESAGDLGALSGEEAGGESVVRIFDPVHSAGDHGAPPSGEKEEFLVRCVLEDVFEEDMDTTVTDETRAMTRTAGVMDMEEEENKGKKPWCGTCAFSKGILGFNCTTCVLNKKSVGEGEGEVLLSAPMIQQEKEEGEEEDSTSTPALPSPSADDMEAMF